MGPGGESGGEARRMCLRPKQWKQVLRLYYTIFKKQNKTKNTKLIISIYEKCMQPVVSFQPEFCQNTFRKLFSKSLSSA